MSETPQPPPEEAVPPQPQPQYGQYQGAPPQQVVYVQAPQTKTNGFSIAALVLGILWIYWLGSILALIFGYIAKSQIDKSGSAGSAWGSSCC